jgi:secreted trypsin-like serine protease
VEIAGGAVVNIEDYPFQVALIHQDNIWCGGTIVSKSHVLTAAHCIFFATSTLYVRAGSSFWNRGGSVHRVTYNATYGGQLNQDVSVLRIWPHFIFDNTRQLIT